MKKAVLGLLSFAVIGYAKDFSQTDADSFLKSEKLVADGLTPKSFENKDGKYIVTYEEGPTQQKFILKPDSNDKLSVVFMERFS